MAATTNDIAAKTVTLKAASDFVANCLKVGANVDLGALQDLSETLFHLQLDEPEQLRLLLDIVRFLYLSGKPDAGLKVALTARTLALEVADAKSTAALLMLIGVCAADTGNLPTAMEVYADALSLAQKNSETLQECKIWQNLGVALSYSGLHRESISCSRRSLQLASTLTDVNGLIQMLHMNMAVCFLNLDEIDHGLSTIAKAIDLSSVPKGTHEILNRVLAENYYARLLVEKCDFLGAKEHAKFARYFASQTKSPRAEIAASVAEGITEVFSGDTDIGISRLTSTLQRGIALKVTIREVLVALVKAHEHIGQHDKALEYLNMMLEQQRKTQAANVLQHVKRHLEQLHVADKDSPIEDASQIIKKLLTRAEVFEGRVAKSELQKRDQQLFVARVEVMERLAVAAELRDDSTGEHSYRVGRLASLLAKSLGCDDDMIFMIDIAARLHDIGKVGIPDGILLKPDKLNASEREVMKTHTTIGAQVLAQSQIPHMQMAEEIARCHHEWWDGNGYPSGISGEDIPLAARITALADVYDALTHKRAYKHAWTEDSALTEILALRGRQFDPKLTDAFLALITSLRREHPDMDGLLGQAAKASPFIIARTRIQETLELNREPGATIGPDRFDLQR
jgi:putative two-component system response regulator